MNHAPAALARQLEQLCIQIGDEVADDFGFVPIHDLLTRFQVELIVRPLLVEGMLATIDAIGGGARASRWAVLIDSEMHNLSDESIRAESSEHPLSSRARNTIAHEVAHSLAFRPSEFGLQLIAKAGKKAASDLVSAIERETERLSPLLLFPEKALRRFLTTSPGYLSAEAMMRLRARLGISREVLVSRLQMLRSNDEKGLLEHQGLRNVALGIAECGQGGAVIRNWPLFINFDRNVVPDLVLRILKQDRMRATDLEIPAESILCGGNESATTFECNARVGGTVRPERMTITLEVEPKRPSQALMFLIRKADMNLATRHVAS